mgnify:CR=1 FL=1
MNKSTKNLNEHLNRLVRKTQKMPRTITEAMDSFSDDDMRDYDEDMEDNPHVESRCDTPQNDGSEVVSLIRKTALKAMADLSDCPESEDYQTLKKIFLLCDNANNKKEKPEMAQ